MNRDKLSFLFLNLGHFLDHFFMLIFASVAALRLTTEWEMSYSELIPYATPGFVAFGVCALLAGWLADKWSREGMMVVFFFGIGLAPGAIATIAFATPPMARCAMLGLKRVPAEVLEAGSMCGTTSWQQLVKVELPHNALDHAQLVIAIQNLKSLRQAGSLVMQT